MKRTIANGALGCLVALLMITGCTARQEIPDKPTPTAAAPGPRTLQGERIVAEGRVVPGREADLSAPLPGIVAAVPVRLGQQVEAGTVLVQLDARQLELQLAQAEANLAIAQAKLAQAGRGPAQGDVAAAQQAVISAQAGYDRLLAGPQASEVTAAKAALAAAQQDYAQVRAGPRSEQLNELAAQLANAKAAVDQAQAAYDRIKGDPEAGMRPQSLQLQQATNNYTAAVAAYNAARAHPTAAELAAAESRVQAAQAALDRLTPDAAQIQAALATVANAQAQLDRLKLPSEERAVLEAGVTAAKVTRDLAAQQIKNATLVAPFAGTVMTLDVEPGEYATPGVVLLRLADTAAWQIETVDLTELNVAEVKEGAAAVLTFDAIPELELPGKVTAVRPFGESRQGDIVYTVVVTPDRQDARLRWNMTAKVNLESK